MFEKYTEKARRAIFFARYEASQLGGSAIESVHLLLGIMRTDPALLRLFLPEEDVQSLLLEVSASAQGGREKVSTSVEMPLSEQAMRVLNCASEEAERLQDDHIGVAHVLLGILRVEDPIVWKALNDRGMRVSDVRVHLADMAGTTPREPPVRLIPDEETLNWIVDTLRQQAAIQRREKANGAVPPIVPDLETAMRIAEAVWIPAFGKERVVRQKPFHATLLRDTWIVSGKPVDSEDEPLVALISRSTGQIQQMGP
jgi:ATP-dependent Clp protease ATP-binding subunit ClpA